MKRVFLDVFDGTKTSTQYYTPDQCDAHCVQGETVMFHMLMNGHKLVLTQTQIMDSGIIHAILNDKDSREAFLEFIRSGKIEIVLQKGKGAHSLVGYLRQSLLHGVEDSGELFRFSVFSFMDDWDTEKRKTLHKQALKAIDEHHYQFEADGIDKSCTDLVRQAVINLQDIDRAIEGRYLQAGDFTRHIHEVIAHHEPIVVANTEDVEAAVLWEKLVEQTKPQLLTSRSAYYAHLEKLADDSSEDAIERVRQRIDNCYNIAVSSSLQDVKVSLNFSEKNKDLIQPIRKAKNTISQLMTLRPVEEAPQEKGSKKDPLTWSTLAAAIEEVDKIQRVRSISRSEAIRRSKNMQFMKPVTMTAHYIGMSLTTNFISAPIADGLSLLTDAAGELTDNAAKKPSLSGTLHSYKNSAERSRLLADSDRFYSLLVDADEEEARRAR